MTVSSLYLTGILLGIAGGLSLLAKLALNEFGAYRYARRWEQCERKLHQEVIRDLVAGASEGKFPLSSGGMREEIESACRVYRELS